MERISEYAPKHAWFGAVFMAVGAGMMALMALDQDGLGAPLWVAEIAAACFVFAGASVVAQCFGRARLGKTLGLMTVYCLTVIPFWIVLGDSDAGSCSVSALGLIIPGMGGAAACKGAFAVSAVLTALCAFALTYAAIRPKKPAA